MKTYLKSLLFASIAGALVMTSQSFAADCTESQQYAGYFACLKYDICNNPDQTCRCNQGSTISHNGVCLGTSAKGFIKVVDSPAYGDTAHPVIFSFKVRNTSSSAQTFVVDFPTTSTKGIKVVGMSQDGLINGGIISLYGGKIDPIYALAAGQTKTISITGIAYSDTATFTTLDTTAYLKKGTTVVDSISLRMLPVADLAITGHIDGEFPLFAGEEVSYTYTVANVGAISSSAQTFSALLPTIFEGDSLNAVALPALAPGASQTFTLKGKLKSTPAVGSYFVSTGSITHETREVSFKDNTAVVEYTVPRWVDLRIASVTTGSANPESAGDTISFVVSYANRGNSTAEGLHILASISGTTVNNANYTLDDLSMNTSGSLTISATLPSDYSLGTKFCLSGAISGSNELGSGANNTLPNLCYVFVDHADIAVTGNLTTNLDTINKGDTLTYTIALTNSGGRLATGIDLGVVFTSPLVATSPTRWSGINLEAGESRNFSVQVRLDALPMTGLDIGMIATSTFAPREIYKANNTFMLNHHIDGLSDVYVSHVMAPFNGFKQGDTIGYTISYGNSGARTAQNVNLRISLPSTLQTATTTWPLGSLAAGQSGTIVINPTLLQFLSAGTTLSSQATISTTTPQTTTTNDSSTLSTTIQAINNFSFGISIQNITRPALNSSSKSISALSGDTVVFNVTYANNGNVDGTNATILFNNLGRVALGAYNSNLGTLSVNQQGTFVVTGIIIGSNFDAFSPVARLSYNTTGISDSVTIQEPYACGDGLVTRNETCDTNGQINVGTGQSCENQAGQCVLVTKQIINTACAEFNGGRVCADSDPINLKEAMCGGLSVTSVDDEDEEVKAICIGQYSSTTTPISINCGNGTIFSGYADANGNFIKTCNYSSNNQASKAKISCSVGNDTVNSACIRSAMSCDLDADTEVAIISEDKDEGEVEYSCSTKNDQEASLQIDCGNGDISDAEDGNSISYTCHYDEDDYADLDNDKTIKAKCLINKANACEKETILDYGLLGICGNGIREGYEQCDEGGERGEGGACKRGCTLNEDAASCLSISNSNISLQNNEIMPFWWKLTSTKNIVPDGKCSSSSDKNMIREDSMKCTFSLKQPGEDAEKVLETPCNAKMIKDYMLFSNFYKNYWSVAFGNYYINLKQLFESDSSFKDNLLGEYKIRLDRVDYEYCAYDEDEDEYDRKDTEIDNVCETNFTVTKPYLVQKSAFGITPKATNINLDEFFDINGNKLITKTDLSDVMILDANDYKASNISALLKTFLNKYNKISIANKYLPKQLQGLSVSKAAGVANKNIYVIEKGNGSQSSIIIDGKTWNQSPFTIITYGINVIVKGNVDVNGMFIVNNGNLIFEPEDCNKQQTVKGIFIVNNGSFNSRKSSNNTSIINNSFNDPRCDAGGLYVKGVLIGNGIDTLVAQRRASLPNWFHVNGSEKSIQVQRRNQILNGAAVVIEYSPDLWKQLPPGADEFTKALDIYKK